MDVTTVREDGGKPLRAWRSIVCDWYLSYEVPPPGKKALFGFYAEDGTTFAGAAFPSGWSVFEGYGVGDDLPLVRIIQGSPQVKVTEDTFLRPRASRLPYGTASSTWKIRKRCRAGEFG